MARIDGLEPQQAGWLTRLLYRLTRRSLRQQTGRDRLAEPVKIVAHQPALLRAVGRMEKAQGAVRTVDRRLKLLAGLRASTLSGCPFRMDIGSAVEAEGFAEGSVCAMPARIGAA